MEKPLPDLNRVIFPPALTPGAAFYVTGEDKLFVSVTNTLAGVVLAVRGRFCRIDGQVQPFAYQITPTSDGVANTLAIDLGEGWLLNVDAIVTSGAPTSSQTAVTFTIVRGDGAAAMELAVIVQGNVTATTRLGWPWSQQVVSSVVTRDTLPLLQSVTNPAAGAQWSQTVPASKAWRVLSVYYRIVTSAAVANRNAYMTFTNSADEILWEAKFAANQTAAQTKQYAFANTSYNDTGFDAIANTIRYPLANLWLPAGAKIKGACGNFDAADQYSLIRINVEETSL